MDSLFRCRPADSRAASRSASLSRRTAARRRRLVIESLEDRRMLATFSYADQLLTINLDAAASTLTTTAAGSGGYTFSLVGDTFSGSDTFGLVGSGKSTLSVTSALALSQITITNSADAAVRLGAGRYVDDVTVSLSSYSNPPVPSFKVTGNASFGGRDLSVTAPSIVVGANISDAKNIALTSLMSVGIQGTSSVSAEGDLSIRATSRVTQATGSVLSIGGIATVTTGAAAINLIGSGNDFRGTVSLANTGANNVSLTDKNALALGALNVGGTLTASASGSFVLGTGSVGGNLIVTAGTSTTNGAITQAAGGIAVAGTSSFTTGRNGILLSDTNNDFGGAVSLSYAGDSWDSAIIDKNALTLGASTIGGNLWIQSGGLSQTGVLSVGGTTTLLASTAASDIDLSTQANLLTGAVGILMPENVRDFKLRNTSATAVADVTGLNVAASLRNLTITYSNNTAGYSIPSLTMSGDATINVNGPLTQAAGGLRVAGTSSFTTGRNGIVLSDANNDFGGAVSLFYSGTAFPAAITDKNALTLGTSNIGGGLTATASGAITQSGAIVTGTGVSAFNAGAHAITLSNAANDFGGAVSLATTGANGVSLTDKNDLALGTLSVGGTLTASASGSFVLGTGSVGSNLIVTAGTSTTNGAITQAAGGIAVAGTSSFTTGRNGITLTNANNDFGGAVSLFYSGTAFPSAITDKNALTLGTSNIGGGLTAIAGGAITQSGAIVTGTGVSAFNAGGHAITLNNAANDFGGAVSLTNTGANNIAIRDTGALVLSGVSMSNAGGTLTVTTNGAVTQTGDILTGTGQVSIDAGAGAVTLTRADNDFRGAVSLANTGGNNISLTDKNDLALGALNVGGTLTASASGSFVLGTGSVGGNLIVTAGTSTTNGAITQAAGGIAVAGTSSFTTGRNGIVLSDANNDFGGAVSLSYSGSVASAITDKNALILGSVTIGQDLTIESGGLSQTGVLSVGGTTTLLASTAASDIDLSTQANLLTGAVGILRPENVRDFKLRNTSATAVADVTGLNVAASLRNLTITYSNNTAGYSIPSLTMSGDATINVNGPLTQAAGGLRVAGTSSFTTGRNGIVLSDANNDFGGAVSLFYSGTAFPAAITDKNALTLGSVTIGQDLTVRSNGALNLGSGSVGRNLVATSFNNNAGSTGAITQSGPLTVGGTSVITAGAAAITLANAANNFTGLVSLTNTGANSVSLTDASALTLGALNVGGTLAASASGSFVLGTGSVGGNLIVTAGTSTTNGAITQAAGGIAVAGTSSFTTGRNGIVLSDANNDFGGAVRLFYSGTAFPSAITDKNALTLGTSNIGGGLTATASGAITQSGAIVTGTGVSAFNAGAHAITLSNAANDFGGAVSLANTGANNIAIRDTGALVLSGVSMSNAGGTLTVTTNGAVTQTGDILTGTGQVSIDAGAGAVTLTRANNDFRGAVSLANTGANSIGIRTTGLLSLSGVSMTPTVSGALTTTSVGVQQVGGTVVTGTGAVSINAGAGTIGLGNPGNDFHGAVSLTNTGANNIAIRDTGALVLSGVSMSYAGGTLTVTTNGAVTQTGDIVTGTGQVSIDAGAGEVTLTRENNFRGSVSLATTGANRVSLTDRNDLALGALNVGGTLWAIASGSFVLGTGSVGGNLSVNAGTATTNGEITQVRGPLGGIAVAGTSFFKAASPGILSRIYLTNANNDFGGTVTLSNYSPNLTAITDKNDLTLGSVTIRGELNVRCNGALNLGSGSVGGNLVATSFNRNTGATGAITQAGKLTVGGTSVFTAGAAAITLTNTANNFTGAVSLTNSGSNNVAITDATALAFASLAIGQDLTALSNGALNLGTGTVGRNLVATSFNRNTGATGAITQAGKLTVGGTSVITAGAAAITLTNAANNFTGAVSLTNSGANDAAIVDATALVLGQSSVGRNLAVTTGAGNVSGTGNLTQTGIVTVAGKTTLTAAAANTTINLATQPNKFSGGVVIAGNKSNVVSYQVVGV